MSEEYNPIGCDHRLSNGWTAYILYSDESGSGPDFSHHVYTQVCSICGTIKRAGHRATNDRVDRFDEEFDFHHPEAVAAIVKFCNYMNQETEDYDPFIRKSESLSPSIDRYPGTWIKVEEDWPEVGRNVLMRSEYLDRGKDASDIFVAYLGEDGDVYSIPLDDNYGWSFKDCITHWMPLPQQPSESPAITDK